GPSERILRRDADRLLPCFVWVSDQSVVVLARTKRAISLITAIRKCLCRDWESCFAKYLQHRRTRQANKRDISIPSRDAFRDGLRQLPVVYSLVVQRAMRLYVGYFCSQAFGDFVQNGYLLEHKSGYLARGYF